MGLTAVYNTIRNHKGNVKVYSVPGQGAEFKLLLPLKSVPPEDRSRPDTLNIKLLEGSPYVLLIDDDEAVRKVAIDMLKVIGCRVIDFANPREALTYYQNLWLKFALVILDLNMPDMNGLQLLGELKKINPAIVALIASGYSHGKDIEEVMRAGARGHVGKPFELQQLSEAVNAALEKKVTKPPEF